MIHQNHYRVRGLDDSGEGEVRFRSTNLRQGNHMTGPQGDTKREQEIAALFEKGGTAAKAALTSARDATERQAQIIIDLQKQMAGSKGQTVDDETLASWTATVDQAVANAAEIQKGFDAIGIKPSQPPVEIPPGSSGLPPRPSHPDYGIPRPEPQKGR